MWLSRWLERLGPDAVIVALLANIGAPLLVIIVIQGVAVVTGWLGVARASVKVVGRAGRSVRRVARLRPVRVVTAIGITTFVPAVQALTVGLCYLMGNYLSAVVHPDHPLIRAPEVLRQTTSVRGGIDGLVGLLRFDAISGSYTLLVIALMLASYAFAGSDDTLDRIANWVASPAILLLVFAALGLAGAAFAALFIGALILLGLLFGVPPDLGDDSGEFVIATLTVAAIAVVLVIYVVACRAAVSGSRSVVNAWRLPRD